MRRSARLSSAVLIFVLGLCAHVAAQDGDAQPFDQRQAICLPSADCGRASAQGEVTSGEIADGSVPVLALDSTSGVLLQQEPRPAQPAHTGFKALFFETVSDFKAFPQRKSTWVILGMGGVAAAAVHPLDDDVNEEFSESNSAKNIFVVGKYLGSVYVQAGIATGLYVIGRYVLPPAKDEPQTNKLSHLGFDLMRGLILSQVLTQAIKVSVQRDRPTGECCAFPSGHASAAFATASILERHLGYRGAWPTFVAASYVAASRLADNRHFLSDVVFGSALGVASGWTMVGRHGRSDYSLIPAPTRGGMAVLLVKN